MYKYLYIYIYMHKNIITYIDSYRSASKTLSLGFQVRKKHFFFMGHLMETCQFGS